MMPNQVRKLKIKKKLPTSIYVLNLTEEARKWAILESKLTMTIRRIYECP